MLKFSSAVARAFSDMTANPAAVKAMMKLQITSLKAWECIRWSTIGSCESWESLFILSSDEEGGLRHRADVRSGYVVLSGCRSPMVVDGEVGAAGLSVILFGA